MGLITFEFEGSANTKNNRIIKNNLKFNKYYGIFLWNLLHCNNITNNNASNNNLFGIFVYNTTSQVISNNTANFNDRGIRLHESRALQAINNTANANRISGFSLINSTNITLLNNSASFNTYEGIFLSNSNTNTISTNNVSSNYFGISLSSSNDNNITDNSAESNYYFEVLLHNSRGNDIVNNTWYIQEDIVYAVSLHVTPSLQTAEDGTNASYYIVAENLGNSPDTFDLVLSSTNNPEISSLDTDSIFLGAREISINTTTTEVEIPQAKVKLVKPSVKTITLNVSDSAPGNYTVKVEIISRHDNTVKDSIETRTIVPGEVISELINSPTITKSAIIISSINNSVINTSAIIDSIISDSTITGSIITNSEVVSTSLNDVIVEDAIVNSGNILSGSITLDEIEYEISKETRISDLIIGSDHSDSNLVGIINKTLEINATNSGIRFNISAKKDYFAGSMSVKKSSIPPEGIPEFTNNVGGYIHVNPSDNLENSIGWLIIKVFYDKNELGAINESSLRLIYFNETAALPGWGEFTPIPIPPPTFPPTLYPAPTPTRTSPYGEPSLKPYPKIIYPQEPYPTPYPPGATPPPDEYFYYFNETEGLSEWEDIPDSGVNQEESYVWGTTSHFSVYALVAQPPQPSGPKTALRGRGGRIRHLPEELIIPLANRGINIFNFEWLGHDITKISIDLKSMKINAKVALKKIDKSSEIPDPPGIVYGYFDISTNLEAENIHSTTIHFMVHKSWTVINDVNADIIKLYRYANDWEELEPAKIKEDDDYFYFSAETKGFSLFAITGWTPTPPPPTPTPTESLTPSPTVSPTVSPTPPPTVSPTPFPDMGGSIKIIVAIVALMIIVSIIYWVRRRRKA